MPSGRGGVRPQCTVPGCARDNCAKGLCKTHYARKTRGLPLEAPIPLPRRSPPIERAPCTVTWCVRIEKASSGPYSGLCAAHARRLRHGTDMDIPLVGCGSDPISTFESAHGRVRGLWGSPSQFPCVSCGTTAHDWAYDGTDPSQHLGRPLSARATGCPCFYSSWPEFYMPLCKKCHLAKDVAARQRELTEYREWRHKTGLSSVWEWEEVACSNSQ